MSLEFCILASGSAGNAAIIRCATGVALIDAGIGPRTLSKRLEGTGVNLADISSLSLTHLDSDHFCPRWAASLVRLSIPIHCHAAKVSELIARCPELKSLVHPFERAPFFPIEGVRCDPVAFAHDRHGSHGFVFDGFSHRIGYATDLGRVPRHLFDYFRELDCIALESNYDPRMQAESGRPLFLQRRITGGRGHLSNPQALTAIRKILDRSRRLPDHIVLLHRSLECNCPNLVRSLFSSDERIAPRLTLAQQNERTPWLGRSHRQPLIGEQMHFAFDLPMS